MTLNRNARLALLLGAIALGVCGCASTFNATGESEFACKAQSTAGVRCMSAREIYGATEQSAAIATTRMAKPNNTIGSEASEMRVPTPAVDEQRVVAASPTIAVDRPTPIRSQAKVMRIWIAPWEDQHGDLHASGLVFTEIEPRRWNLGERLVAKAPVITPLQVTPSAPAGGSRPATPSSSTSTVSPLSGVSVGLDSLQPNTTTERTPR